MAQEAFSVRVTSPAWRATADAWIAEALAAEGIEIVGPIEQRRVRAWSTQLVAPTDAGPVWFKACCPSMAFEPALQQAIADLVPGAVQRPLAIDAERGWMLTRDHGPPLGDRRDPTLNDWRAVLAEAARVQQALAGRREELLAAGLPDAGPETVPTRFDRLLEIQEQSPAEHGYRVSPEVVVQLRSRRSELVDACALLAESTVPSTWQHGDLHPWNVHADGDRLALFDLGDGMWSHAVEILAVPYGVVTEQGSVGWADALVAWLEAWQLEPEQFEPLWRASAFTHAVNRAVTWHRALATATTAEVDEWGEAVEQHLASMLDA